MRSRSPAIATLLAGLAVVTAALLGYARTLDAPYVFDDVRNISENPAVRWERIGLDELRRAAFESPTARPVSYFSFGVQYALGAERPGLRVANLAIHAANGLLVLALALGTYRRAAQLPGTSPRLADPAVAVPLAALAGVLFVVHPIQTQAVTYLVQRMASLATLFYLAALWLWLRGGESTRPGARLRWRGLAVTSGLAACGAKEIAVMLPFAVWLYEATFLRDDSTRRKRLRLAGLAAYALCVAGLVFAATRGLADFESQPFGLLERLWSAPRVLSLYASLLVLPLPSRQNLLHDLPASVSWIDPPSTALAALAWITLCALAIRTRRRVPFASFAIAWALLHLALESSFLPLALVFEHRLYLPMVGLAIALPPLGLQLLGSPRRTLAVGLGLALALLAATIARNEIWRDPVVLWRDVVAKSPTSERGHNELGLALQSAGEASQARAAFERAFQIDPSWAEPLTHLGWLLHREGDLDAGERLLLEAVALEPGYARAWHALGLVRLAQDQPAEAADLLARAVELSPRDATLRSRHAAALARASRPADARAQWLEALRIDPRRHDVHAQLGELALVEGHATSARDHLRAAVQGEPRSLAARNNLAWLLATTSDPEVRDPAAAVVLAEALAQEAGQDAGVLDTLAAAYAADGQLERAERTALQAAARADATGEPTAASRMRRRAELYRAGRPLFEGRDEPGVDTRARSAPSMGSVPRIYSTSP
jgi:Flp pilus assembly protein TadD